MTSKGPRTTLGKSFVILPGRDMGILTADDLKRLADITRRYNIPAAKLTGAQRLCFLGTDEERLPALKKDLGIPAAMPHARGRVHYVQACPGIDWCKFGVMDAPAMGRKISELALDHPLPYKVKVGVSGCRICCCESWVRDIGLIGGRAGWKLVFGGNAAAAPRIGDLIAEGLDDAQVLDLIRRCLAVYSTRAAGAVRSARFIEQFGIEEFRQEVFGK